MTAHFSEADYAALTGNPKAKRSKYGATPTIVEGIRFASKAEAARYQDLLLLQRAGEIRELELQPRYELHGLDGSVVCRYVADFAYVDLSTGTNVCEDVKGVRTAVYRIKAKLLAAEYGVTIQEVRA